MKNEQNFKHSIVTLERMDQLSAHTNSFCFVKCIIKTEPEQKEADAWKLIFKKMADKFQVKKLTFRQCSLNEELIRVLCENVRGLVDLKIGSDRRIRS